MPWLGGSPHPRRSGRHRVPGELRGVRGKVTMALDCSAIPTGTRDLLQQTTEPVQRPTGPLHRCAEMASDLGAGDGLSTTTESSCKALVLVASLRR